MTKVEKRKRCTLNTSAQLKPKFVSILRNIKLPWMQNRRKYILVDANFTLTYHLFMRPLMQPGCRLLTKVYGIFCSD